MLKRSTVAIKSTVDVCDVLQGSKPVFRCPYTLEASCILLVAMAVHTQTTRLRFQTSVLLYGVYTDKKGNGETIFISSHSGRQFHSKCS